MSNIDPNYSISGDYNIPPSQNTIQQQIDALIQALRAIQPDGTETTNEKIASIEAAIATLVKQASPPQKNELEQMMKAASFLSELNTNPNEIKQIDAAIKAITEEIAKLVQQDPNNPMIKTLTLEIGVLMGARDELEQQYAEAKTGLKSTFDSLPTKLS
jgi:chromosome segregation ATPase